LFDLALDIALVRVTVNHLHEDAVLFFNTEGLEPFGETSALLVKRYKTVHQGRDGVVLTNLLSEAFTERSLVHWGLNVFDMEHEGLLTLISVIEVATISSA
jgi:hypothetical protein